MEYKQAHSTSSQIAGTVKCTYVELFDVNGRKVFSLQKKNIGSKPAVVSLSQYDDKGTVPVRLTEDALQSIAKSLSKRKKARINKNQLYAAFDNTVYVKPVALEWQPVSNVIDPDVEPQKAGVSPILLAGGAAVALLLLLVGKRKKS